MKYNQFLIVSFIIISGLFIAGCSGKNSTGSVASEAYAVGVYSAVAIPAAPLYPILSPMTSKPYHGKTREQIIDMIGKPIARYQCKKTEVWEYRENQVYGYGRFISFFTDTLNIQSNHVTDLDKCTLLEGAPSKKTKEEWTVQTFDCGGNFVKYVYPLSKIRVFLIDMKTNHGEFTITQWRRRGMVSDPRYVISYDGKEIYKWPKLGHKVNKPTKIIDSIKFGPGKSTKILIRVLHKAHVYNELKISCPK